MTTRHVLPGMLTAATMLATLSTHAADYVLSPNGSDTAAGTRAQPWQTIEKINASVRAGDTVSLLPGDYAGALSPQHGGEPGKPILFRADPPLQARLRGGDAAIDLTGKAHLVFDGLLVEPKSGRFWTAQDCSEITVTNCQFRNSLKGYSAMLFKTCGMIRLLNCRIARQPGRPDRPSIAGNMIHTDSCDGFVIDGCTIGEVGHSPAFLMKTSRLIVRRTLFYAGWGRAFEVFSANRVLFENNVVVGAFDSAGSADSPAKAMPNPGIFRRNLMARSYGRPITSSVYGNFQIKSGRFYHNTVCCNLDEGWSLGGGQPDLQNVADCQWLNNIFHNNDYTGNFRQISLVNMPPDTRIAHNIIAGDAPGRKVIHIWNQNHYDRYTVEQANALPGGLFSANLDLVPRFVNAAQDDFRLAPGSPGVDAAAFLARTTREGSGRDIPVSDALCFYDGFELPGEQGDLVWIGTDRRQARVLKADRSNNVLVVDRPLHWRKDEPVSLPYSGRAPDIGAMEAGAEHEAWYHPLHIPNGSYWTPPADPRVPLLVSDWEPDTRETWGILWNMTRRLNSAHERVADTAAGGKYSLRTYATGSRSILAVDTTVRFWELDRYPFVHFAYRIPNGVAVGLWVRAFRQEDGSREPLVCLAGSAALPEREGDAARKYTLTDDGQWHRITVDARAVRAICPTARHLRAVLFRNSSGKSGIGDKGDQFWLDDFSIEAR
ncbi:MAG: right-handed parallel beta-helix repeat-containing protein [Kiritimatiellae bacterium]|nr:right-handed parallel beta-helix repeat-containing protein [Kiritimatiellia bacterium]